MKKEDLWQKYGQLSDEKAIKREKRKRKRMPISGKSVFKTLRLRRSNVDK